MDVRNQITWCDENEDTDGECSQIDEDDQRDVEFHRCLTDVVGLGIEGHDARIFLHEHDTESDDVSPDEALSDDEYREPEEGVPDDAVSRADGLQRTDHLRALKDDDEQAADHREACHTDHQD